jgi:hypothetical protein
MVFMHKASYDVYNYTYRLMESMVVWMCIAKVEGYFKQVEHVKSHGDDCSLVEVTIFVIFQPENLCDNYAKTF